MVEATVIAGAMAIRNWQSSQRMLEPRRLQEQLALVAQTQQRLLPVGSQKILGLSVAHYSRYCEQAGGDYVDTVPSKGWRARPRRRNWLGERPGAAKPRTLLLGRLGSKLRAVHCGG